jgi:hypothetical protein
MAFGIQTQWFVAVVTQGSQSHSKDFMTHPKSARAEDI